MDLVKEAFLPEYSLLFENCFELCSVKKSKFSEIPVDRLFENSCLSSFNSDTVFLLPFIFSENHTF